MAGIDWKKEIAERLSTVEDRDAMLEAFLEHAPVSLQVFLPDGQSFIFNPALVELMGRGPPPEYNVLRDEILERQGLLPLVRRAFAGETVTLPVAWYDPKEHRSLDGSGTRRVGIQTTVFPLFDRKNAVSHVVVLAKDVTAELELRLREERQRLAFEAARMIAIDANLVKRTLQVSDNAREVLGLVEGAPFDAIDHLLAIVHHDDRPAIEAHFREAGGGDSPSDDRFRVVRPRDGRVVWLERRTQVWVDDVSGDPWRRGVLVDVTERVARDRALRDSEEALRRTEEQLRQAKKLEAIGQLAGGIAHDFNNLLSVILCCVDVLERTPHEPEVVREAVEAIERSGQQGAELTRQLLAFSRQQVVAPRVLDLNDTVRWAAKMLARLLDETIVVDVQVAPEPALIHADPGQVAQVVMNLAINARDAMPAGGALCIETKLVTLGEPQARELGVVVAGPHVMLSVRDSGVGMDPETQRRMFEPFFTTKGLGSGTGLGLATVFGVVQQSGGAIGVQSKPGGGTTITIWFPLGRVPEDVPGERGTRESLRGDETILLVEDREDVRHATRRALERYGYDVLVADGPAAALERCTSDPRPIHLLLTDVVMPAMSGVELAERVTAMRPDIRVMLVSGYAEHAPQELPAGYAFLQKPLVPEVLARCVRQVLEGT